MMLFVWLFKVDISNNVAPLEDDKSQVTGTEEKISNAGTEELVFVLALSDVLQTSMRSGSPQLLDPPPPSPREPVTSDTAGCPESGVSKSPQTPSADVLASHFAGEAWFHEAFTDCVCTSY